MLNKQLLNHLLLYKAKKCLKTSIFKHFSMELTGFEPVSKNQFPVLLLS